MIRRGEHSARGAATDAALLLLARQHLTALASVPRRTGGPSVATARSYCARTLKDLGFAVDEFPFTYSQFPGRLGTPMSGVIALLAFGVAAYAAGRSQPRLALGVLLTAAALLTATGSWLAKRGVLSIPWWRTRGVNLVATRRGADPRVWLVAHLDSKSQPVPMAWRVAGIAGLALVWLTGVALAVAQIMDAVVPAAWMLWAVVGVVVAAPVIATGVGDDSAGAVDNASGAAAALVAARLLTDDHPARAVAGVLLTDAEELGLAGARAWVRGRPPALALNCDGVDDVGQLVLMYGGRRLPALADAICRAAAAEGEAIAVRHLIPGVLVDSLALQDGGFDAVTISRGNAATLRRVHTALDDLDHLSGAGIPATARVLARAVRELS